MYHIVHRLVGFPGGSAVNTVSVIQELPETQPWAGRAPGGGRGHPCQGSRLQSAMGRGAHVGYRAAKSRTRPSHFSFFLCYPISTSGNLQSLQSDLVLTEFASF